MMTLHYLDNMLCINNSNQVFPSVGFKGLIVISTARTKAAMVHPIKDSSKTNTIKTKNVYALATASFKNAM